MHSTIDMMERLDVASERGLGASGFTKVRSEINAAQRSLLMLTEDVTDLQTPINDAKKGFSGWQSAIVTANQGVQLIQQGIQGINKVTGFFDGLTGISSRLNLITEDQLGLQDKIYQAAQRSRGEYTAMASSVAKLNLLAADSFAAFGGENATIDFVETLNKAFVLSGAGTQERESAMYQMTQALSSGRLQGDEYRSIIENAPLVAQAIEDYMRNVKGARGTMKDWSSEGLLTSDVIIAAVQNASKEVNQQFADMPMKFSDHMTKLKNEAINSLAPITARFEGVMNSPKFKGAVQKATELIAMGVGWLDKMLGKIEQIANNPGFQQFASSLTMALGAVATVLGWIISLTLTLTNYMMSGWPLVEPVVWGVVAALLAYKTVTGLIALAELAKNAIFFVGLAISASKAGLTLAEAAATMTSAEATKYATAQQWALNSAFYAFPGMWIILIIIGIIVAIYAVVNAINYFTGSTISATGVILGTITAAASIIWNIMLTLVTMILKMVLLPMFQQWDNFANFFGNLFVDPIAATLRMFADLADNVLSTLETMAAGMDAIFGTNLSAGVQGWRKDVSGMADQFVAKYGNGKYEQKSDMTTQVEKVLDSIMNVTWQTSDAWETGYTAGEKVEATVEGVLDQVLGGFDFSQQIPEMTVPGADTTLDDYGDGGKLNVNADGSDVSISDDDIKYLRDIAKLEYVNQYTTLRPVVQAQFGDVHETADVNQIIKVFEDAIEGAYESSLGRG